VNDRRNGHAPSDLAAAIELAVAGLEYVERRENGSTIEFSRRGKVFAAIEDQAASYRLSPAVTRAAMATPDTRKSERGADWVTFSPSSLARFALDRAVAWLESAWRNATA